MATHSDHALGSPARRGRPVQDYAEDTYKLQGKPKEPSACRQCGVVFHKGRWTWAPKPADAQDLLCPACHRIADRHPQGELRLSGPFMAEHKQEILGLIEHVAAAEKAEHPFARIMSNKDTENGIAIETTDIHLPRRIGEALHHAYQGEWTFHYDEGEQFIRAKWSR